MNYPQETVKPAPKHSHYVMMPFIAEDELDPFEFKLMARYLRLAWGSGKPVSLSAPKGCKACRMSEPKFYDTRKSLHEKGYIILTKTEDREQPDVIEVCWENMWARNAEKYQSVEQIERDFMHHITSGSLDSERLLALKDAIEQMLGVPKILGVPSQNIVSPSQNMGNPVPKYWEHLVDIESIDKDSNLDSVAADEPPVAKAVSTGLRDDAALNSNARVRQAPEEQPVDKNIEDHALTMALSGFEDKRLSTKQLDKLKAKNSYEDQDGGKHTYPSLIDCYDTYTGFDKFVEKRLSQAKNVEQNPSIDILISNLKNFHKKDGWYGWLKWKELNPEFTTDRAALPDPNAPAKVVYKDTSPESASRWLDNLGDDIPMELLNRHAAATT